MKKNNKCIAFMMSVMLAVIFTCNIVSASTMDRSYSFYFSSYNQVKDTGHQPKENSSSLYMNYSGNGPSYIGYALGYTNFYGARDCSYDPSDPAKYSYKYRFSPGNRRFMYNYVKENGYNYAGVRATSLGTGTAAGVWSPDSVYEAGVLPESDYIR